MNTEKSNKKYTKTSINPKVMAQARLMASRAFILNAAGDARMAHRSFMEANELMRDAVAYD